MSAIQLQDPDTESAFLAQVTAKSWRVLTDQEFASYLMYPKVFLDYLNNRLEHDHAGVLPTLLFFHGMSPGEEVSIDIGAGQNFDRPAGGHERTPGRRHAHRVFLSSTASCVCEDS